jgi:hypothetical protein
MTTTISANGARTQSTWAATMADLRAAMMPDEKPPAASVPLRRPLRPSLAAVTASTPQLVGRRGYRARCTIGAQWPRCAHVKASDVCWAPRWGRSPHCREHRTPGDTWTRRPDGYRTCYVADHPLADARGLVLVHRRALWDSIGPGWHFCHECGQPVTWDVRDLHDPRCLVVDHVDHCRANNTVDNLRPLCPACSCADNGRSVPF